MIIAYAAASVCIHLFVAQLRMFELPPSPDLAVQYPSPRRLSTQSPRDHRLWLDVAKTSRCESQCFGAEIVFAESAVPIRLLARPFLPFGSRLALAPLRAGYGNATPTQSGDRLFAGGLCKVRLPQLRSPRRRSGVLQ